MAAIMAWYLAHGGISAAMAALASLMAKNRLAANSMAAR